MKRTCIGLATALAFAVFGSATVLGQQAPAKVEPDKGFIKKWDVGSEAVDIQEEVEILRRLLDKSLTAVYGPLTTPSGAVNYNTMSAGMPGMGVPMGGGMPFGPYLRAERPAPDLEGVYLKDYGVVYTVTLPPPPNGIAPGPTAGVVTRTPLTPWERTRKELRGEKIEDEGNVVSRRPSLPEVILKVLADNGKHLTRLAEGERITVVVTFRDDAANGVYHPQQPGGSGGLSMPGMPGDGAGGGSLHFRMASPTGAMQYVPSEGYPGEVGIPFSGSKAPSTEEDAAWVTDVRNAIRLGDLHRRQNKDQEANAAYQEAVDKLDKGLAQTFPPGMVLTKDNIPALLTGVALYNKLAQVFVTAGNPAAAREMLEKASGLMNKANQTLNGAAPTAKAPATTPALPSKLVVTASKKLLDEVGSGKLTFEAFTKAATVENVTPPAADKK